MALSDTKIKTLKPKTKSYKLADEKGLFLLITPKNAKHWKFKYRFEGKEKKLSFGAYPEVKLIHAREKRDEVRKLLADGIDPSQHFKTEKLVQKMTAENSFEKVALEWHMRFYSKWTPLHATRILIPLKKDIFPWIGDRSISEIKAPELLSVIRRIEERNAIETAHRALQNCCQVFRYAIATGRAERDITYDLRGALQPVKSRHHASITEPKAIGALLRAISGYEGHFVTKCALRLAPLVFVRPGELRHAEWTKIDFENKEWRIPAEKMKMR